MQIVKVRFAEDAGTGREYSYYSAEPLEVGAFVMVPVKTGMRPAKVTQINIHESEIAAFKDAVKTIPSATMAATFETKQPSTLSGAIIEAAKDEGTPVTIVEVTDTTAVVRIAPDKDPVVVAFVEQVQGILRYANERAITSNENVKDATNDLTVMSQLTKSLESKREEYVKPLNGHVKTINGVFKSISDPLDQAFKTTKAKILSYNAEVERKRLEIEKVNREAEELAKKQAELSGTGEFTVDTTPLVVPPPPPAHVRTEQGAIGNTGNWTWELVDINLVPKEYLEVNAALVGGVVRGSKGKIVIPGIKNVWIPGIRVTTR